MAGEELARAIERVDQQESLRHFVAVRRKGLLGDHRGVRQERPEPRQDQLFGVDIGP